MPSPLLLVTEIPVESANADKVLAILASRPSAPSAVLYRGIEAPTVLELAPLSGFAELDERVAEWRTMAAELAPLSVGDIRRQILEFVEAPKPVEGELPATPFVQLRHVEVKPPVKEEYLAWRVDTIFAEVHKSDLIEGFLAYHSVVSNEPGVMFVSGFSCAPEEYSPIFVTERYAEIARQAHPHFVTDQGLYTRIYRRVDS